MSNNIMITVENIRQLKYPIIFKIRKKFVIALYYVDSVFSKKFQETWIKIFICELIGNIISYKND